MLEQQVTMSPPTGHLRKQFSHSPQFQGLQVTNIALNKILVLSCHKTLTKGLLVSAAESKFFLESSLFFLSGWSMAVVGNLGRRHCPPPKEHI